MATELILSPEKVIRVQAQREVDEARVSELDEALGELHDAIDRLKRRRDDIDRGIRHRDEVVERAALTGADPVEVTAQAILRAIHGEGYEASAQVLETARRYARAVVVDLDAAGMLNASPTTTGDTQP